MTLHTLIAFLLLLLLPECCEPELPPVAPEEAEFGKEYRILIEKPE